MTKGSGRIILVGLKHTGKSTVGRALAGILGAPFVDTDDAIERLSGKTARRLHDEGGRALMAEWETRACAETAALEGPLVVATGGGLSDNAEAARILRETGTVVFLDTDFETVYSRILESAKRDGRMPSFLSGDDPRGEFGKVFARRRESYATMAHVRVETGALNPLEICRTILDAITA